MLTVDEYLSFRDNFTENERLRYPRQLRRNKKKLRKRLKHFEQQCLDILLQTKMIFPVSAAFQKEMYLDSYHEANDRIAEDFKLSSDLVEILEYNMFNGFRATWEFDLKEGKPDEEKIAQTINLNTSKLQYDESPYWDGWVYDIRKRLIKDVNLRLGAE